MTPLTDLWDSLWEAGRLPAYKGDEYREAGDELRALLDAGDLPAIDAWIARLGERVPELAAAAGGGQ